MLSHGKIKTRQKKIGQADPLPQIGHFPVKPTHCGVFRTTDQCLPFCPWKNKECSGYLGLWQRASLYRGQPAPREKERLQNQHCGQKFKKKKNTDNFRTKSNLKTNYPITEVKKTETKK